MSEIIESKAFSIDVDVVALLNVLDICSKSEARRLIRSGAVRIDGEKVGRTAYIVEKSVLQVGKRICIELLLPAREVTIERTGNEVKILKVGGYVS